MALDGGRQKRTRLAAITAATLASALVLASTAFATWQEPVAGANQVSNIGRDSSMASIGGAPYVAWDEKHGATYEVFVARLNASGSAWEKVGGPVNFDSSHNAFDPVLTDVGGKPYVAWTEDNGDASNPTSELRIARLNAAGNGWEEPWRGVSAAVGGIGSYPTQSADSPTLTTVGGVPYVAWNVIGVGPGYVARAARLDAATLTWEEPWTGVSATAGGIQQSAAHAGYGPAIASINNTPYVVWREGSGTPTLQVRVARLNGGSLTWTQDWQGVSATSGGINDPTHDAGLLTETRPSLVSINNFPYVAWTDYDGTNLDARVARLDTSTFGGPTWKQEAAGVSATDGRINQSPTAAAISVSLTSVSAGAFGVAVPYIAWNEITGNNVYELRAARFNPTTKVWEQVWPGVTQSFGAIGETATTSERYLSLVSAGGVPYLSRWIYVGGSAVTAGVRISRLEPEFVSESAAPSAGGEAFTVTAHTYGIPYPFGFQYGPALDTDTTAVAAPAGSDTVTVTRQVGTLRPKTTYEYRAFAQAGAPAPLAFGSTLSFTTNASGTGTSSGSGSGSSSAALATVLRERLSPSAFPAAPSGPTERAAKRRSYGTKVTFNLDRAGSVRFSVTQRQAGRRAAHGKCVKPTKRNRKARRCKRVVTLHGSFTVRGKAGTNSFRFTGRLGRRSLKPGKFRLEATPISGRLKGRSAGASFRIVK